METAAQTAVTEPTPKPPLGLKPRRVNDFHRREDVKAAIARYEEDGRRVPSEWVDELNELDIVLADYCPASPGLGSTPGVPVPPAALVDDVCSMSTHMGRYGISCAFAAWGANEQLRLCVEWLRDPARKKDAGATYWPWPGPEQLEALASSMGEAMRPEPPSLKEQALEELEMMQDELHAKTGSGFATPALDRILESLPD